MTDDVDWTALARYVTGRCSSPEIAEFETWIAADPERRALVEALRATWVDAAGLPTSGEIESGWQAVAAHMRSPRREQVVRLSPARRSFAVDERHDVARAPRAGWRVARIAAAVTIATGGALMAWRAGWLAPAQPFREFTSARGSRTTITLRDGSRLVLGPATRLRVPGDFDRSARMVELDGEALLTVVHDTRHPFAVRTTHTTVRDVGTTFVVHAYAGDPVERVAVAEGEVAIGGVALRERDGASVDTAGRVTVRRGIDLSNDLAWVQGGLVFKDTPLRDAVRELSRLYDVDVTIADSALGGKPITASFHQEPVEHVLDAVVFVAEAHYERTGRSIVIRRGVAPAGRPGRAAESGQRIARATTND